MAAFLGSTTNHNSLLSEHLSQPPSHLEHVEKIEKDCNLFSLHNSGTLHLTVLLEQLFSFLFGLICTNCVHVYGNTF